MKPKALLVDFGGVLTTSIWTAFESFCEGEGLDAGTVRKLFKENPDALAELRKLETGEVETPDFERRFAALLGEGIKPEGLVGRLFAGLGPDPQMIEAVQNVKASGAKTALVSNSWGSTIYEGADLDSLFDAQVISGDVGLHKPEPEIYLLAAKQVGTDPADCVFVDDLRENIAGAEAVGMIAVLHREPPKTVAKLTELFEL